jgi:isoquinoline 1-oxidoreductase subunit alpha
MFSLRIDGLANRVDLDSDTLLLWILRDVLGMTGTTIGCGLTLCGGCAVHPVLLRTKSLSSRH